jgi:hypothetical protein
MSETHGTTDDGQGGAGQGEAVPGGSDAAVAPARRRRGRLPIWIGAGVLLLVLAAAAAVGIGRTAASHRPEAAVADYLQALQQGDAERAFDLDGTEVGDDDVLLTDEAYATATDRVSGFSLAPGVVDGDSATVEATVQQGGETGPRWQQSFTLESDGRDLFFFPRWELQPVALGSVTVQVGAPSSATVSVAGVELPAADSETVELRALPGSYDVELGGGGELWGAPATEGTASGAGSRGTPAVLVAELTEQGEASARAAVDGWVAGCVGSPDPRPDGCSFALLNGDGGYQLSNQKWTLESAPTYDVGAWDGTGWDVSSVTEGAASYSADARDASGATGTFGSVSPVPVRVAGVVTDVTPEGATFEAGPFL